MSFGVEPPKYQKSSGSPVEERRNIQMGSHGLLGREMVDVRLGNAQAAVFFRPAGCAGAILLDGAEVLGVARMLEIQNAAGRDCIAEALGKGLLFPSHAFNRAAKLQRQSCTYRCSGRPYTIEHVCSESHGNDEIFGVTLFVDQYLTTYHS